MRHVIRVTDCDGESPVFVVVSMPHDYYRFKTMAYEEAAEHKLSSPLMMGNERFWLVRKRLASFLAFVDSRNTP